LPLIPPLAEGSRASFIFRKGWLARSAHQIIRSEDRLPYDISKLAAREFLTSPADSSSALESNFKWYHPVTRDVMSVGRSFLPGSGPVHIRVYYGVDPHHNVLSTSTSSSELLGGGIRTWKISRAPLNEGACLFSNDFPKN